MGVVTGEVYTPFGLVTVHQRTEGDINEFKRGFADKITVKVVGNIVHILHRGKTFSIITVKDDVSEKEIEDTIRRRISDESVFNVVVGDV